MTDSDMLTWVAGADGCRAGWFVVLRAVDGSACRRRVVPDVAALLDLPEAPVILGVDMVIGLPDAPRSGGRACDRQARQLLGWPRSSSVFSPPAQAALAAETYAEAQRLNRAHSPDDVGLTKQAFHLFPKLRALDRRMTPERQQRIREVHPELAFFAMNGDAPTEHSKHTGAGRTERRQLLAANGFEDIESALRERRSSDLGADDMLDAHAVCWTAQRIRAGTAQRCPSDPPRNECGLRMEIWR